MDALTGAPVPAQPPAAGGTPAHPLIPGQVVSARVVQALAADTFLLAVRGQTLVAQSPTPLPLDTVVQLAVRSGGSPGEPISVRLLPSGSVQVPSESAPAVLTARTIAAQLGFPESELGTQLVAALQRQGVPLRPAVVAPLLRLLQEAQEPLSTSTANEAPEESASPTGALASGTGLRATPAAAAPPAPAPAPAPAARLPARTPVPDARQEAVATTTSRPASGGSPPVGGPRMPTAPLVAIQPPGRSPLPLSDRPSGTIAPPAQQPPIPMPGTPGAGKPGPAIVFVPTFAAAAPVLAPPGMEPAGSGRSETPAPATDAAVRDTAVRAHRAPVTAQAVPPPATPVRAHGQASSASAMPGPVFQAASPAPAAPQPSAIIAFPATAATLAAAPAPGGERPHQTAGDSRRSAVPLPRPWPTGAVRAVAAMPEATRSAAVARLAASPLPISAALLPLAAIAVRASLPSTAHFLPQRGVQATTPAGQVAATGTPQPDTPTAGAVGAPTPIASEPASTVATATAKPVPPTSDSAVRQASPTAASASRPAPVQESLPALATRLPAVPFREAVDLAQGPDPRPAIRQGLALAGLVASAPAAGEPVETPPPERLLTMLLSRVLASARPGPEPAAASTGQSTVAAPRSDAADRAGPRHQAALRAHEEAPGAPAAIAAATDPAPTAPAAGSDLAAVHEQVARDLLPPQELAEYERVLAVPLAIAGQPLPARLAVTTRRSASGAQACWMRLDCDLSRLGPVSVRLGGVEGAPLAITLVARPAAAAELAAALPQLTQDLHQLGVEAALRVVAEDEASS